MTARLDQLKSTARQRHARVVFPEGEDERVLKAAQKYVNAGYGEAVVLGEKGTIANLAQQHDITLNGVDVIDPHTERDASDYIDTYRDIRPVKAKTARSILGNELLFGGLLVRKGEADAMVGGCVRTTGDLISAAQEVIGLAPGIELPSSFFLMEFDNRPPLIYADAGMNPNPKANELADIAVASAESAGQLLEEEPRVALLSFSTRGSASHPDVEKVQNAVEQIREHVEDIAIDGEFQADAALNESIAKRKLDDLGSVAGRANTLIFPDLDAANISYKLTQELANASAYGPILQGFAHPVSDLSRGASSEDILSVAILTVNLQE